MMVTGSLNTLFGKWADRQVVQGNPDQEPHPFNHPFFQACAMFLGEMLCGATFAIMLLVRKIRGQEIYTAFGSMKLSLRHLGSSWLVFFPPAMCDVTGTSIMFMGLNYTTASSFQMLRGAVIIFTALLSVAFLHRHITNQMWTGIGVVLVGLIIVGLSDFFFNPTDLNLNSVITGDELIIMAQIVAAVQMVYEERFVTKLDVNPLLAVGLEGLFGFTVLSLLMIPMYYIDVGSSQFSGSPSPPFRLEDAIDAFYQIGNSIQVAIALIGLVLSIAFFNWSGISVTKELSATTRMVIDSCRTLVIWAASLALGWQDFEWLQIIGFIILTIGIFVYNGIVSPKIWERCSNVPVEDEQQLVVDDDYDHHHHHHGEKS